MGNRKIRAKVVETGSVRGRITVARIASIARRMQSIPINARRNVTRKIQLKGKLS